MVKTLIRWFILFVLFLLSVGYARLNNGEPTHREELIPKVRVEIVKEKPKGKPEGTWSIIMENQWGYSRLEFAFYMSARGEKASKENGQAFAEDFMFAGFVEAFDE